MSLDSLVLQYMTQKRQAQRSPHTLQVSQRALQLLGESMEHAGRPRIVPMTADLDQYIGFLQAQGGITKTTTVNAYLRRVREFCHWCQARSVSVDPGASGYPSLPVQAEERPVYQPAQVVLLEQSLPAPYAEAVTVLANTGLRRTELFALTWPDVNFDRRLLTITKQKNHAVSRLPLNDAALTAFDRLRSPFRKIFHGSSKILYDRIKAVVLREGWDHRLDVHALRSYFIVQLILRGTDIATVCRLARHKSILQTMAYFRLYADDLHGAVASLGMASSSSPRI